MRKRAVVSKAAPVEKAAVRVNNFAEVGQTGLRQWAGRLDEEFLNDLKWDKGRRAYREMRDNSPVIGAGLFAIEQELRRCTVRVEPGGKSNEDGKAAEFVETCLTDMSSSWEDTLTEALTMLPFGWGYLETVFKYRQGPGNNPTKRSRYTDGMIGWRKWALRGQDSLDHWEFDESGGIQGMWQRTNTPTFYGMVPIEKALLFRTKTEKGNPEGRSILRNAYIPYQFVKLIQQIEGIGIERDLAGLPIAYVPPDLLTATSGSVEATILDTIKNLVTNIRRNEQEGVVFPLAYDDSGKELYKLELLTSGGARQFDTTAVIQRHEQRMLMCMLADMILMGHEKVGSYSLADSKNSLFGVALEGFMDAILGVINQHAIPRLMDLNGIRVDLPPQVKRGDIAPPNLQELGEYVGKLSGAGMLMFPSMNGDLERHLLKVANLPEDAYGEGGATGVNADWLAMMAEAQSTVQQANEGMQKLLKRIEAVNPAVTFSGVVTA